VKKSSQIPNPTSPNPEFESYTNQIAAKKSTTTKKQAISL